MEIEYKDIESLSDIELTAYYDELYDIQSELDSEFDFDSHSAIGLEMSFVEDEMTARNL